MLFACELHMNLINAFTMISAYLPPKLSQSMCILDVTQSSKEVQESSGGVGMACGKLLVMSMIVLTLIVKLPQ